MAENQNTKPMTKKYSSLSLRAKILAGNLLIVLFTVAAMGYFMFYRSQVANEFIAEQFDVSVNREIENRLTLITAEETNKISNFFSSVRNITDIFGATVGTITSSGGPTLPDNSNWSTFLGLSQLPSGSWDNPNGEAASIFVPANMVISDNLTKELTALKGLDTLTLSLFEKNPDVIAIYFGGKSGETVYYPNIDLAALVPADFDITGRPWYVNALNAKGEAVWAVPFQNAALNGLVITNSKSVYNKRGEFLGVAGIDIKLVTIIDQVSRLSIGKTGYGFLIDANGRAIAMPSKGVQDFNLTEEEIQNGEIDNLSLIDRAPLNVFEVLAKMTSGQSGIRLVNIQGVNRYIAYKPIPIVGYSFGMVVDENELLQEFVDTNRALKIETQQTIINSIGVMVFLLAVAGLASYGIGNSITAPLGKLTNVAEEVAEGNLNARAEVNTGDEIGILGNTLNSMTSTAQELVTNLENKVIQRTKVIEKRIAQIQAVAEIGKAVAAQRDLEELLIRTTHLISNRFGYYHVGIFLIDPRGGYAVLRAANSSGGKQMLTRNHKLRVGVEGIVGTVASTGEPRSVLDVGEDAVYFDNPNLPQTRSEMALPLIAGGDVLGVLDIQSIEANAFTNDDIPTLQVLADQLATAVQNARLLRDTREALIAARKATGDASQISWRSLLQEVDIPGYIGMEHGEIAKTTDGLDRATRLALEKGELLFSADQKTISVPIISRGQTIGMMRLAKPDHAKPWTTDELTDVEQLSYQISNALDSARLYGEAQQRSYYEQAIREIATSISSASEMETILQTAVEELGRHLNGPKGVTIEMTEIDKE